MASKKKLKRKLAKAEAEADRLFNLAGVRGQELTAIDAMLMSAEFPGPTIEAWAYQMQVFLQQLIEARRLGKRFCSVPQETMVTGLSTSGPELKGQESLQTAFDNLGKIPAGEDRFA